jgi:hypothetical protein
MAMTYTFISDSEVRRQYGDLLMVGSSESDRLPG